MAWGKPWIEEEKVLREMSEQGKCERFMKAENFLAESMKPS
jgi:hypothetical protein